MTKKKSGTNKKKPPKASLWQRISQRFNVLPKIWKVVAAILIIVTFTVTIYTPIHIYLTIQNEQQIRVIINDEANFVKDGKLIDAVSLYADNAVAKDAAGGNNNLAVAWMGKDQINVRYSNLAKFTFLIHSDIHITVNFDLTHASATAGTNGIYLANGVPVQISSNQGEKWAFEKVDGVWKITSFTFNLPS